MNLHTNLKNIWGGVLLLAAVTLLYFVTLDNGLRPDELTGGDLITHQYAQAEARPGNAPGYPLYTMGGWLSFQVGKTVPGQILNPVQILSAYSMMWGVAALAFLYLILLNVTGRRWPIAALLTAFHATTFFFWYYSVTTEQYTSAVFQTVLVIWLAFRWDEKARDSTLLWMAFVSGTMLANMVTTLFILPPLLGFIFFKKSDGNRWMLTTYLKRPGFVLKAVGVGLLPLLSYAYIFIRGAQHPEWRGQGEWPSTWAWFVDFITIQQGRDELAPGLGVQNIFTDEFPALMWQELTWPLFFGGLLGLAFLGRRRAIFLYATLLIYFVFCWGYRFGNWFQVIIPAYPIFTIGFAALLHQIIKTAQRYGPNSKPMSRIAKHAVAFITIFLAGLLIYRFAANFPKANQRNLAADTGLDPGWLILADAPPTPALVSVDFSERVALQYLSTVWGFDADIVPVDGALPPDTAPSAHLYISRKASASLPEIINLEKTTPQAAGQQLIRLPAKTVTALPATVISTDLNFGNELKLVGWEIAHPASGVLPPDVENRLDVANWQVALYWQSTEQPDVDYTMSLRALVKGQPVRRGSEAVIQDHQPVWGVYPTSRWRTGALVRDLFALNLPEDVTPDAFQIVVYRAIDGGFENLADYTVAVSR